MPGSRVGGGAALPDARTTTPQRKAGPLAAFLHAETLGALLLLAMTAAALLWANSPAASSYDALWSTDIGIDLGTTTILSMDLRHWVNEALMVLFFFVVGLEIKREITVGELADPRRAALPIAAALGGMIAPAAIYLAVNAGGPGMRGWGIPIATDIAFALGALALFGRGAPVALRLFLLSVAIADDIGSIAVIALFYARGVSLEPIAAAALLLAVAAVLWRVNAPWRRLPLAVLAVAAWAATLASGIHPTIAGVAAALLTPAGHGRARSPAELLEETLHPWTSFVVIPLFALANAGVTIDTGVAASAIASPVGLGIAAGLVLGKLIGVTGGAYLAVRLRLARLPSGVAWDHVVAASGLAGIGYTVSLFIAGLSFSEPTLTTHAKVGILVGSALAGLVGATLLRLSARRHAATGDQARMRGR